MKLLIGIDLGTTGIRSIVYDERLRELGCDYREYSLITFSATCIEQDAHTWWELVRQTIAAALEKSGQPGGNVAGIGISSQGIAFLPVDGQFEPMMNAISWLDSRADEEAAELLSDFGAREIYEITGKRPNGIYVLPKLMWLKKNCPDIFNKAAHFLMAHDFILAKLCGKAITDCTMASGTMMFDITERRWSGKLLARCGVDAAKLPEVLEAGHAAGTILPHIADELGLGRDVVIAVGGQDQKCASLGAGIADHAATVSLGTAAAISRKWNSPRFDGEMRIPCFAGLQPGSWVTEGVLSTAASSLKWLRQTFFSVKAYHELDDMASEKQTEGLFFYPHLAGTSSPDWFSDSCGCYYGIRLNTTPGEMIRALYEGVAFQIRKNIEIMQDDASVVSELRLFGGGAASPAWCRIIADVTGLPVRVPESDEVACVGAAMLAGLAAGIYPALSQPQGLVAMACGYTPDRNMKVHYDGLFNQYVKIEKKLFGD